MWFWCSLRVEISCVFLRKFSGVNGYPYELLKLGLWILNIFVSTRAVYSKDGTSICIFICVSSLMMKLLSLDVMSF